MNKSKQIGTRGETEVVKYLNACGLQAQRRALHGNQDQGDIEVYYPYRFILEIKSGKQTSNPSRAILAEWLKQTEIEGVNASMFSALVVKRYNRLLKDSDVYFKWHGLICHMYLDEFTEFILEKGDVCIGEAGFRPDLPTK